MTKEKKAGEEAGASVEKSAEVAILSLRHGDILCPCGTTLKCKEVSTVSKESAEWLLASFKDEVKVVK
ncbi:MAG: hypothetical protein EBX40_04855 [Gammaproteobacteria bacterium]|nr:hypothetical protein [Gammaproteobacteria bacterium]